MTSTPLPRAPIGSAYDHGPIEPLGAWGERPRVPSWVPALATLVFLVFTLGSSVWLARSYRRPAQAPWGVLQSFMPLPARIFGIDAQLRGTVPV